MNYFYVCIDCGSNYCPCELAETGDCLVCSRLSGKTCCSCDWKGVCVYSEFVNSGRKAKRRPEFEAEIVERKDYDSDVFVLVVNAGHSFAQRCRIPGSYVFLKNPDDDSFCNIPISVMYSDEEKGYIHLALKITGCKSKKIAALTDRIMLRGVYRNGIIGVKNLIKPGNEERPEKIMIITKGIGIAPAVLLNEYSGSRALNDIYADTEKIDEKLISDYLPNANVKYISLYAELSCKGGKPGENLKKLFADGRYDKLAVFASDYYLKEIGRLFKLDAMSNNFRLCCGEGICGACTYTDENGNLIRMCKCAEILGSML